MTEMLKEDILKILSKELKGGLKSSTSEVPQTFIGGLKADPPKEIPYHKPKPLKHENSEIVGAYPIANNGLTSGGRFEEKERPFVVRAIIRHRKKKKPLKKNATSKEKEDYEEYINKGVFDYKAYNRLAPSMQRMYQHYMDIEDSYKKGLISDEEINVTYKLPQKKTEGKYVKGFTKEMVDKAKKPFKAKAKAPDSSFTASYGVKHRTPSAWQQFVKEFSKTYKGDNKDRLKEASKAYKAKGSPPVPPPYKDIVKAPAKDRSPVLKRRTPLAWQQFVKEFSKTYKGDNKDRLKDASKAYKAKGSPISPPPPANRSKKPLTITKTSSGEVIPVKRREKKSAEKKAPAPAKPKAKAKKLKKKLVLVEPEPDNRIKEALDKYKLHLSRIEGYVEDGSFEKGDDDYNDMIKEAEEEADEELKKLGSSLKKELGSKPKKAPKKSKKKKLVLVEPEIKLSEELAPKKSKKSKKKKLVLVEPKANLKLVIKEKKQLPPCPPKKVRDPVTNRCKHKKKFTKAPSKYNEFVKQFFKENKGTTLKLASIAWKAHKEGKVAEPQSRKPIRLTSFPDEDEEFDEREPTPYLPDDDDSAITESGLNIEQPRKRKKHNLKVVDKLPTANENRELADILDSFDDMVKGYEEIYNSGEGGDNKLAQFRIIDERAEDYHLNTMAQQDKFSQEALNRIEGAYNHVKDESRRLKQTINNGVPQQQISADTYDYDSEDDHLVDALHVEPSTLDDSNFGVAFAPTEDTYEWDASAVPPLKVGEVSMQNYPFERIYEAPPKFRDEYDVLYPPPAEYSDFRSDVVPPSEKRDLKADIEERVFAKYMEIMKRFNPNTSNNHIKEMWAKNRADIYDLLIDELADKKGGFIGDILTYDPAVFANTLEKIGILAGGMCEDECDGGAYGGELIGRGGALRNMPPKKLIGKIIFELFTRVAKEKGYQNMKEITALYKKYKKRVDDSMFDLMEERLMKAKGGSYISLPSGADASKFYKSGDRFYEKRERPKVFDRAIYDAKNNITRTSANTTANTGFIPRVRGANREPIKAPMQTDEEKEKDKSTFGDIDLPYQDVDMTDLGDPKAWANTAYDIGASTYSAVKDILSFLPQISFSL